MEISLSEIRVLTKYGCTTKDGRYFKISQVTVITDVCRCENKLSHKQEVNFFKNTGYCFECAAERFNLHPLWSCTKSVHIPQSEMDQVKDQWYVISWQPSGDYGWAYLTYTPVYIYTVLLSLTARPEHSCLRLCKSLMKSIPRSLLGATIQRWTLYPSPVPVWEFK